MLPPPLLVLSRIASALESLGVAYLTAGSFASSAYGTPRTTQDVDLVADLRPEHAAPLATALEGEFYVDQSMILDAILRRKSFNVIHLATMFKADIFVSEIHPWARSEMSRRQSERFGVGEDAVTLYLASPEDTILHKLEWYRQGGGVSDRQWTDVLGVLKVQGVALDLPYLRQWAGELGLTELLDRALDEAGLAQ
jgi:hypothetical protein